MAAAALLVGGSLLQAYGAYQSSEQKAAAYRADALNKQAQAAQVEIAADRNANLAQQHYDRIKNAQIASISRSGTTLSGSNLAQMEQSAADAVSQIAAIRQGGTYHKTSILTEGLYDSMLADQTSDAGLITAGGYALGAFSKNPNTYDRGVR